MTVPDGTYAAFPTKARDPISVRRKATWPLAYVALPTVAMSATKQPSPRVSRSGSMWEIVETSAPLPTLVPSARSQRGV